MYSQPFHCIREYIQNSYDSIREARRNGSVSRSNGEIRVLIDEDARSVAVHDNGTGLSPEAAAVHLLDIGKSSKAQSHLGSDQNAGFRGIGRLAGVSYCKKLRFETSIGDGNCCVVEFNADGINRLTARGQEPAGLVDAVTDNAQIWEEPAEDDEAFLKVTLEGLAPDSPFLKEKQLQSYLSQVAPVPFDPLAWSFREKLGGFAEDVGAGSSLEEVKLLICDAEGHTRVDVRRPFRDAFRTKDGTKRNRRTVNVTDVERLPSRPTEDGGWWGWLAVHDRRGALADVPFAGLRIRMHNIAVGDDTIVGQLFPTRFLARWCFGEIHITNLKLVPNSQRDNFEPSPEWNRLRERLREAARRLERDIRRESTARSRSVATIAKKAEKEVAAAKRAVDVGFLSQEEKQNTVQKLERASKKLQTEQNRRSRDEGEKAVLRRQRQAVEDTLNDVRAVKKTGTEQALAHLNKQARRALRVAFRVLGSELPEKKFKELQQKIYRELRPGARTR
ncbi:MAG: ATP-binding protein [Acidobacteria bacterium]|nr:ATP-binding protein [Acidobacteriota bacterium]